MERRLLTLAVLAFAPFSVSSSNIEGLDGLHDIHPSLNIEVDISCSLCTLLVNDMYDLLASGLNTEEIIAEVEDFCYENVTIVTYPVCVGMVDAMGPELIYVLNNTQRTTDEICSLFLREQHCNSTLPEFSVEVPSGKPEISHPAPSEGSPTITVLHISDPHIDYLYKEGSLATDCGTYMCCRETNQTIPQNATLAGYWGAENANCDLPVRTLELMLEQAAQFEPDLIYITGDHPAHDLWMQSRDTNLASIQTVVDAVLQVFPDTLILHSLGNHESFPANSYPVPSVYDEGWTNEWLYDYLAEQWARGGIPSDSLETVRTGAFYTYSPLPGLRVVAVNMMYCYTFNWWILIDNDDPTGQLSWLTNVLLEAEAAGEKVHILDHISTGSVDCEAIWSHQLNRIYSRFESTITAFFSGHHHCDQFRILWDVENNTRPIGVSYLIPSGTPYARKSPAFRIFTVDGGYEGATWAPVDHFTYTLNLTAANNGGAAEFKLAYAAKEAYGLNDLTPSSWAQAGWQMATDTDLFHEYIRHYYNYWEEPEEIETCDVDCRKDRLCEMYRGDSSDDEPCNRIMDQVDQTN